MQVMVPPHQYAEGIGNTEPGSDTLLFCTVPDSLWGCMQASLCLHSFAEQVLLTLVSWHLNAFIFTYKVLEVFDIVSL